MPTGVSFMIKLVCMSMCLLGDDGTDWLLAWELSANAFDSSAGLPHTDGCDLDAEQTSAASLYLETSGVFVEGVLPSWWCRQCCRNPTSLCTLPRITKSPLVHCVSSSAACSTCANQRDGACLSGLIRTPWFDHACCGHQSWLFSLALSLHCHPRLFDPLLAGQQCGRRNWSKAAWTHSRCCSQRR